jgi:hypothetical protein
VFRALPQRLKRWAMLARPYGAYFVYGPARRYYLLSVFVSLNVLVSLALVFVDLACDFYAAQPAGILRDSAIERLGDPLAMFRGF